MAQAIILGLLGQGILTPDEILIHSAHPEHYQPFAQAHGLQDKADNQAVVAAADLVILAVKPSQASAVLAPLVPRLQQQQRPVLSLLSGVSLADLAAIVGDQIPLVRVMPNLNVQIGAGLTALAANQAAQATVLPAVTQLFAGIGTTLALPEADFSTFVALAGSAPAFAYLFMDALAHAGVKYGLTKAQALAIVSQMTVGSAQMIQQADQAPWSLIDAVASPGGTTIAGVLALQAGGFETALTQAVDAVIAKDQAAK